MEGDPFSRRGTETRVGVRRSVAVVLGLVVVSAVAGGSVAAAGPVATGGDATVGRATAGSTTPTAANGTTGSAAPTDGSATVDWPPNATAAPLSPASEGDLAVSNPHLVAYVDADPATRGGVGTFTLQTAAPDGNGTADLLYGGGDAWSSYLTVRVDGETYVTGTDVVGATNMDGYVTRSPTARGDGVVTEWTLPEGVVVTQTVSLDGSRAAFDATVENADGTAHDARVRFLFDYQLGAADGSPVRYAGGATTTETAVADPGFAEWRTRDRATASPLTGRATTDTRPTRVAFARWNPAYGSPYAYAVDPDAEFYDVSRGAGDGAGLVYYDLGRLDPGESASVRTGYGPGRPEGGAALDVPDQETAGTAVTVARASLPEGGFLGVHGPDGRLLGVSDYLPAGEARNVTVGLDTPLAEPGTVWAVAYRDADGDGRADVGAGDDPYPGAVGPAAARANVTLTPPPATVAFENQTTDGRAVVVDSATLSAGGFVALRDPGRPATAPGSVVGVSDYLPPGTHEDVRIRAYRVPGGQFTRLSLGEDRTLAATPYRDTDGDERYGFVDDDGERDGPYAGGAARVADTAAVRVAGGGSYGGAGGDDDAPADAEPTHYQVDFVAGEPMATLSADRLYADEDRLIRWALGSAGEGVTDRGTGWASADVRTCVDAGAVQRDGGTARVSFTVAAGCSNVTLSLVSYTMPSSEFSRETADEQELFDATTRTVGPGDHALVVTLPGDDAARLARPTVEPAE